jgi:hypothetical protein
MTLISLVTAIVAGAVAGGAAVRLVVARGHRVSWWLGPAVGVACAVCGPLPPVRSAPTPAARSGTWRLSCSSPASEQR